MWKRLTKLQKFFFVLIVLSLLVAVIGKYICDRYLNVNDPVLKHIIKITIIGGFYMFVPAISVLIIEKWKLKKIFSDYQIRFKNIHITQSLIYILATAILLPVIIMLFSYLLGNILGLKDFGMLIIDSENIDPRILSALPPIFLNSTFRLMVSVPLLALSGLTAGCTINLLFAMGEEIAWRGFLEKEISISKKWKPLLIGVIWGLWHTPLILIGLNYGEHSIGGIFAMIAVCIALAYYFSQSLHQSRTLLVPAALHGIINAFSNTLASDILIKTENPLLGSKGIIFVLSVVTLIFVLWVFRNRLYKNFM
jgi:hypothetical protein